MDQSDIERQIWFNTERVCHVCGSYFRNINSIGKHECREHFGTIRNGVFTCCKVNAGIGNRSMDIGTYYATEGYLAPKLRGCIGADHREFSHKKGSYTPYNKAKDAGTLSLEREFIRVIGCNEENIIEIDDPYYLDVCRYNRKQKTELNKHI